MSPTACLYHLAFFSRINPAAWLFGSLFILQALLLAWYGIRQKRLKYSYERSPRGFFAVGLITYALIYPAIGWFEGFTFPRMPTFGIPCPTTILTAGFLLAAHPPLPPLLLTIPIVWAFIGGSAAFLLGVHADLMLPVAGIALITHLFLTWRHSN